MYVQYLLPKLIVNVILKWRFKHKKEGLVSWPMQPKTNNCTMHLYSVIQCMSPYFQAPSPDSPIYLVHIMLEQIRLHVGTCTCISVTSDSLITLQLLVSQILSPYSHTHCMEQCNQARKEGDCFPSHYTLLFVWVHVFALYSQWAWVTHQHCCVHTPCI